MIQKHHHLLGLIKAHSTWNEAKWETDLWSDEPTWMPLSPQWRREGPSSSFTVFSSKHCMVWRCVSAYEIGIYISKRHINAGKYIQVLKPHMFLSFRPYFITASIPTACVTVEESRCWSCVTAVQTFHQLKIFGKSWNENITKKTRTVGKENFCEKNVNKMLGLWDLQMVGFCLYLHFTQQPNFLRVGFVYYRFICISLACLSQTTNVAFIPSFFVIEFNGKMLWACFRASVMFAQSCLWRLHALMSNTSNRSPATYPHFNAT